MYFTRPTYTPQMNDETISHKFTNASFLELPYEILFFNIADSR